MKLIKTLIFVVIICIFLPMIALAQEFQTNVRVDDTGDNVINQSEPTIVVNDSGNIYVVWTDERNGHPDIYFAKSGDNGASFSASIKVNDSITSAAQAAITIDGDGNILVAWQDERNGNSDIYFAKSTNGGTTFGTNVRVDDTGASTNTQSAPTIGVHKGSGNIYVAWTDDRDSGTNHIYFAKSMNGGTSFDANTQVDDVASANPDNPALTVDDNDNIYLVWEDERNGNWDGYFAQSTDGGTSFGADVKVNDVSTSSEYPALAVDSSGNIYVTWQDYRNGDYDIYLAKSIDITPTFSANVRVDDTTSITSTQRYPDIAVNDQDNIYLVWQDERGGVSDIYFSQSTDGGTSFSANIRVDDTGTASSEQTKPALIVDASGYIYTVWSDNRKGLGDADIYFARAFPSADESSGSSGDGSGSDSKCFIATAAYGTPMADEVIVLRRFRDKYLLPHPLGKKLVDTYYKLSPPIAEVIRQNESLRGAVRIGLTPLISLARFMVNEKRSVVPKAFGKRRRP